MKRVLTIGLFDGVHLGHQALLTAAREKASALGLHAAALTFSGLDRYKDVYLLTSPEDRDRLITSLTGVPEVITLPFDRDLRRMTAENFFFDILIGKMDAEHIVIGENFTFGSDRAGAEKLTELCDASHVGLSVLSLRTLDGAPVSSSRIRDALIRGELDKAEALLGHPHLLSGKVIHGRQVGREIGCPTINLAYPPVLAPMPHGVYVTTVTLSDGRVFPGISDLGVHPTFGESEEVWLETHIPGHTVNLYDETVTVNFRAFLRPEKTFPSPEALCAQIGEDMKTADAYFKAHPGLLLFEEGDHAE